MESRALGRREGPRDAESGNPDESLWQCVSKCGPRAPCIRPTLGVWGGELVPMQIPGPALNEARGFGVETWSLSLASPGDSGVIESLRGSVYVRGVCVVVCICSGEHLGRGGEASLPHLRTGAVVYPSASSGPLHSAGWGGIQSLEVCVGGFPRWPGRGEQRA